MSHTLLTSPIATRLALGSRLIYVPVMDMLVYLEYMQYTLLAAFVIVVIDLARYHAPFAGFLESPHAVFNVGKIWQVCGTIAQEKATTCMYIVLYLNKKNN